jgi:uncharacterized membrane protein YjgN (DUF898 family)
MNKGNYISLKKKQIGGFMESRFEGSIFEIIAFSILIPIVLVCTLFLATPWVYTYLIGWVCKNSIISGKRFKFNGTGLGLFGRFILWWILTIITLGIYGFWATRNMIRWIVENTEIVN